MTYFKSPRSNIWRRNWSKRNSRPDHMIRYLLRKDYRDISRYYCCARELSSQRSGSSGSRRIASSSVPIVSPTTTTQAPPIAPAIEERVRRFLEACEVDRNLSQLTIRQYDHYLDHLLTWLGREQPEVQDLPALTTEVVRQYKLGLARHVNEHTGRPLSRATQTYFLVALRSLLRYWALQGLEV